MNSLILQLERWTLQVLLAFLIAVPGSALVSVKAALFLAYFFISLFIAAGHGVPYRAMLSGLFWFVFLVIYTTIGINRNEPSAALREFVAYVTVYLFLEFVMLRVARGDADFLRPKVVTTSLAVYALLKFALLYLVYKGMISAVDVYDFVETYSPGSVVSAIHAPLPRITTANDYLLPLLLLWYLVELRQRSTTSKWLVVGLSLCIILILLSLSRYLYIFSFVILLLYTLLFVQLRKMRSIVVVLLGIGIVSLVMSMVGYDVMLLDRFVGKSAESSDYAKMSQIRWITDRLQWNMVLGNGLGAKVNVPGRTFNTQIEVQWLGLLYKIGIVGIAILSSYLVYLLLTILRFGGRGMNRHSILLASVFALWILGGFFNPVLLLTTTAVNYVILITLYHSYVARSGTDA